MHVDSALTVAYQLCIFHHPTHHQTYDSDIVIGGLRTVSGDEDALACSAIIRSPGLLVQSSQMTGKSTKRIPLFARDLGGGGSTGQVMSVFYFVNRLP